MTVSPHIAPSDRQQAVAAAAQRAAPRALSLRSVLIGLALIPPDIIWVVLMERVDGRAFSSTISLFFTAVFFLLLVTAANRLVYRLAPRYALRQGELLVVFSMISIATVMPAVDFLSPLISMMPHGYWFATPENNWQSFWQYLPSWLLVSDKEALKGYYLGNSSLYRWEALRAWLPPIGWWTLFIMALLWVMACFNTMLRAQWTEKERLTYPIVQLPVAMTAENGSLFRNRLFWMGFAFAGGLNFINGMHFLFPSIPALTFNGYDALQWFPSRPWNAIGWTPLAIFPFIVGLGYLLPIDLLFSCWFFFLFWKLEKVAASAMGYMAEHPTFPYVDEQMFGGYMAICVFALWTARPHLRNVWLRAIGKAAPVSDEGEPMRFRTAVFGALAGIVFLLAFSYYAGLPIWLGVLFFLIYFAIAISVTRMRAELGPPTHDLHFIGPYQSLYTLFGSKNLGPSALAVFTIYYWFNRAYRCHPMPHELEGFKMAQISRTSLRGWLAAMLLAAFVGIVATFWTTLHVSYRLGAAARIHGWSSLGFGTEAYNRLSSWLSSPTNPDTPASMAMVIGFLIASALILIKMNVYGWPFHALGFAISGGWSMWWAWLSLFVAWVLKTFILRYSGLRGYRAGLPFFFGVILGDFLIGGIWTLLGLIFNIPIYSLWSG
ncbi:MAG TPA: DUF6785 family protein [Chthonomonadaceae bacterium]|nr:DUF6785 family protein [Chthonomonadaceae bacterium]